MGRATPGNEIFPVNLSPSEQVMVITEKWLTAARARDWGKMIDLAQIILESRRKNEEEQR